MQAGRRRRRPAGGRGVLPAGVRSEPAAPRPSPEAAAAPATVTVGDRKAAVRPGPGRQRPPPESDSRLGFAGESRALPGPLDSAIIESERDPAVMARSLFRV